MKTALVTGASSGIGKATAVLLAQNGYHVYGAARRTEKMEELKKYGIKPISLDVTKEESLAGCVEQILKEAGSIDILVNSAGSSNFSALEDTPISDAKSQFELNLFGVARLIQLVLPAMRKNKYGKIVNISSVNGKFSLAMSGWYSASKFALEGLSDALRNEVKQFGIDVIVIEPGGTKTEIAALSSDYLMRVSGNTVYKELANKVNNSFYSPETVKCYPEPILVAKLVKQGIEVNTPRTRYVGGAMMKFTLLLKRFLSDKMFDKMINSQLK
ncbi:oxidoreductase [Hymenobacter psoromatis]|uniref:oxidoreductase n=1 Tax=Hymenobacter psoromatis TaxID=1484116 RepID=UPI001CBC504B|nr:oxidoreductase [Hymenobacter psoromatis]